MKILSPFTIFGFNLFCMLGQKNQRVSSTKVSDGISFLQSFKYFIANLGDRKQYENEEELEELGGVFAQRIVEDHIISTAGHKVSREIVKEITNTSLSSTNQSNEIDYVSSFMEIPQDILDIMQENDYPEEKVQE